MSAPHPLPFELRRRPERFSCIGKVVNVLFGEGYIRQPEEGLPPNSLNPFTHPFVSSGVRSIDLDDLLDRVHHFGPSGRIVGKIRNNQPGKHGRLPGVGNLAACIEGDAVSFFIGQGQARADGVFQRDSPGNFRR